MPVFPPFEQLVVVYVASQRQFAIGYYRAGVWQVQPTLTGTVTHWAALSPPGSPVTGATSTSIRRDVPPPRSAPPKPPYNR
ncbi:MAG: hypothetical protein KJ062_16750 [Thermoanaerobaculia bacterium]|nr:hypothetical protein [Thermoanaerobaculia bacterium]